MYVLFTQRKRVRDIGHRFITLAPNPWRRLRANIQNIEVGNETELAEHEKSIQLTNINNKVYRTLTVRTQPVKTNINLTLKEWLVMIDLLKYIDKIIYPSPTITCSSCKNEIHTAKLHNGSLRRSQLSRRETHEIKMNNKTVQNQMGLICEHCGIKKEYECHCHLVICRECSPECFCDECDSCLYYFYEK